MFEFKNNTIISIEARKTNRNFNFEGFLCPNLACLDALKIFSVTFLSHNLNLSSFAQKSLYFNHPGGSGQRHGRLGANDRGREVLHQQSSRFLCCLWWNRQWKSGWNNRFIGKRRSNENCRLRDSRTKCRWRRLVSSTGSRSPWRTSTPRCTPSSSRLTFAIRLRGGKIQGISSHTYRINTRSNSDFDLSNYL